MGEQADSAEFVHMLSSWTAMQAISNCWERRVQTDQNLVRHDSGDKFMPLTLQIDPQLVEQHEIGLSTLLRSWHHELGMVAGITDPEDLLLLHIDRLIQSPTGTLSKCQAAINFGWDVQVPVLTAQDCTCTWMTFTVIACIAHLGHCPGNGPLSDNFCAHFQRFLTWQTPQCGCFVMTAGLPTGS